VSDFSIPKINSNLGGPHPFPDHTEVTPGTFARTGGNINFTDILAEGEYFFRADSKLLASDENVKKGLALLTELLRNT
jgi:hypothetical protein